MCLGIPMRIVRVDADGGGEVELDGARQQVSLALIEAPQPGEHVIVHAGFAIERLDPVEAEATLQLFREMALGP